MYLVCVENALSVFVRFSTFPCSSRFQLSGANIFCTGFRDRVLFRLFWAALGMPGGPPEASRSRPFSQRFQDCFLDPLPRTVSYNS